jgi:hypothetical protein
VTVQQPVTQRPAEQHSPAWQSAVVAQQAAVVQRCVPGSQHSPALQSAVVAQQSVAQRPAEQHSPALQSAAVAQQAPAPQSLVPGSQHSPALQSAFEAQAQGPQSPSVQHSPALQSAAAAQHGSHWWPWQHWPGAHSAAVQHVPRTQRGSTGPAPELELLAATVPVVAPLVAVLVVAPPAPPAPVVPAAAATPVPPLPQPGPAAQARATTKGISAASRENAGAGALERRGRCEDIGCSNRALRPGPERSPAKRASAHFSRDPSGCGVLDGSRSPGSPVSAALVRLPVRAPERP